MKTVLIGGAACGLWLMIATPGQANAADIDAAAQGAVAAASRPGDDASTPRGRDGSARPRGLRFGRGGGDNVDTFLTPQQTEEVLTFTEEHFPQVHERLTNLQKNNSALFNRSLNRVARYMLPLMRTKTDNPELAEKMIAEHRAQLAVEELSQQYRDAKAPARKQQLREQLRKKIEAKFDARLERMRTEITGLQQRLDDAREHLAGQEQDKQKLIDERLTAVTSSGAAKAK